MFPQVNFNQTKAYAQLKAHYQHTKEQKMRELFATDPLRAQRFSITFNDIFLDFSKNRITQETLDLLTELADECALKPAIEAMFNGEKINVTEQRPVLHTALRNKREDSVMVDGENVMPEVYKVLQQMQHFSDAVINGSWKGYSGLPITDIVNIGIGGSDLGPSMVTEALKSYSNHLRIHFVSNIDGAHINDVLQQVNTATTLFIIASKSFTTQETMMNAHTARQWFLNADTSEADIAKHFVAISTNIEAVTAFGIGAEQTFHFWDWVGGRFSLWSAIGLSICLSVGYAHFEQLLAGAHEADVHFRYTPFQQNIPVILALLGIWYHNFYDARTHGIFPYCQHLKHLPAYLQQADMESNGKIISRSATPVIYSTSPIIWGEPGTNGQHAFFQLLHQGSHMVPGDFIVVAKNDANLPQHNQVLLANCFAQTEALMRGKTQEELHNELQERGFSEDEVLLKEPFMQFEGNKPSNTILLKALTPFNLGALIAFYEHKIFTQGVLWNIYSFDQYGVEIGKQLASIILPELQQVAPVDGHDGSTNQLLNKYKQWK